MRPEKRPLGANDQIRALGWTRAFAAPEVINCDGKWQTIKSDMYTWAKTIKAICQCQQLPEGIRKMCEACLDSDPSCRPQCFSQIAADLEKMCSADCLGWGRALWQRQQACFVSGAHSHRHASMLCKQGLQVLLSQRQRRRHSTDGHADADLLVLLAAQSRRLGNPQDAIELVQQAIVGCPNMMVSSHLLEKSLAESYDDLGECSKPRDLLERVLKSKEAHYGKEHPEFAQTLHRLGFACENLGDFVRGKDLLIEALKIKEAHYGKEHHEVAGTLHNLGLAYTDLGDHTNG